MRGRGQRGILSVISALPEKCLSALFLGWCETRVRQGEMILLAVLMWRKSVVLRPRSSFHCTNLQPKAGSGVQDSLCYQTLLTLVKVKHQQFGGSRVGRSAPSSSSKLRQMQSRLRWKISRGRRRARRERGREGRKSEVGERGPSHRLYPIKDTWELGERWRMGSSAQWMERGRSWDSTS